MNSTRVRGFDLMDRVNYFTGQLLTTDDLRAEQDYLREKHRRHNRHLHGWGVVSGLDVHAPTSDDPSTEITLSPGYAITATGEEICVDKHLRLDLAATLADCEPMTAHVAIRYTEVVTHPARDESEFDDVVYSRVHEGFEVHALRHVPERGGQWVILADIRLSGDPTVRLTSRDITYQTRRTLSLDR
jgi:hypothetical protein